MDCMDTDACNDVNVSAKYAPAFRLTCEGNADRMESYSSCERMFVDVEFATEVSINCNGDYSCYSVDILATTAQSVNIDVIGSYGGYGGHIWAQHANAASISCKSQYHEYGCYHMEFYIPPNTQLECEGHGCYFLDLYAP